MKRFSWMAVAVFALVGLTACGPEIIEGKEPAPETAQNGQGLQEPLHKCAEGCEAFGCTGASVATGTCQCSGCP